MGGKMSSDKTVEFSLQDYMPYRLACLVENATASVSSRYKTHGVSIAEWRVLAVLGELGTASSKVMISHTNMDKSRINRALNLLQEKNWVVRKDEPSDRRQNRVKLTRKGQRKFVEIAEVAHDWQSSWLGRLNKKEMSQLDALLKKLASGIPELQ
jgi:DNA-binding MarR family transcriptional regulator